MAKKKQEDLSSYDAIKKAFIKRCEDLSHVRSLHDVIRDFAELGRITIVNQLTPFYSQDDEGEYQDVDRGYMITQNELETLKAVETHGQNLNTISLASLLEKGLIYTEWSDYGYKISEAGTQLLDGEEA